MRTEFFDFEMWLVNSCDYSQRTMSNIVSRFKRANSILPWCDDALYVYRLEQTSDFAILTSTVKSQIKKSIKLFSEFIKTQNSKSIINKGEKMKITSLFANIGVAEAYFDEIGFEVAVANELVPRRAALYSKIYPKAKMICGDITDKDVFSRIVSLSREENIDVLMATPPCQGMSTAGQQKEDDIRNSLICPVVKAVLEIQPRYVFIENVPMFFNTMIETENKKILIPEYIKEKLSGDYEMRQYVIDTKDYSVPQTRDRAIILLTRKGEEAWELPPKETKVVTMMDAIGGLPMLDPFVTDITQEERLLLFPHYEERRLAAERISFWHRPPEHVLRQVVAMQHTPTGCSAFDNKIYYPTKEDGTPVKGYHNTYKRQNWDTPAYTVTMDNRKISSQNNVHPGRLEYIDNKGDEIYSDARTLTLYELMIITSLPNNWNVPQSTSEAFLRRIIGEGIPPLFVKKVFEKLKEGNNNE